MAGPLARGPLVARWGALAPGVVKAGARGRARVEVENAGAASWRSQPESGVWLAYHWLDDRGNAIVWDGIRTELPGTVAPGERVALEFALRGPIPPGRYRLAVDLVDEGRVWFAEIGGAPCEAEVDVAPRIERRLAARGGDLEALEAQEEPLVPEDGAEAVAFLAPGVAPVPDWSRRVLDAHEEGYGIVGGSVEPVGGLLERRRAARALEPWAPRGGRVPRFAFPLLCPSVAAGVEPEWVDDVEGLPALRPPREDAFGEPWLYDARIAVRARLRSGRPPA